MAEDERAKRVTPRCSTQASREEERCGAGGDTTGSIPAGSIPTCHPPSLRAHSGSSSIFARDGLKGAFPAGEGERRFGSLLIPCPACQSCKAFSCRSPLCLGRLQGRTGGTCKVSPVVKPPLVVRGFVFFWVVGSCNASPLSLSMAGALAAGCWGHPEQGTRMPRVQPLPPKHTGTTLGF